MTNNKHKKMQKHTITETLIQITENIKIKKEFKTWIKMFMTLKQHFYSPIWKLHWNSTQECSLYS